jgi:hypothetical protein
LTPHAIQSRPSIVEINRILSAQNGLIVHFSGAPKGFSSNQPDRYFPDDLKFIVDGKAQGGVSCSVVFPGDRFDGIERNATGCVGLVLGLRSPDSLIAVSATDCGTVVDPDGYRVPRQAHISTDNILSSIEGRPTGRYNEWVVADFDVLGVFAIEPLEIWGQVSIHIPSELRVPLDAGHCQLLDESQYGIIATSFKEVAKHFLNLPLYTFRGDHICRLVEHHALYSA